MSKLEEQKKKGKTVTAILADAVCFVYPLASVLLLSTNNGRGDERGIHVLGRMVRRRVEGG